MKSPDEMLWKIPIIFITKTAVKVEAAAQHNSGYMQGLWLCLWIKKPINVQTTDRLQMDNTLAICSIVMPQEGAVPKAE